MPKIEITPAHSPDLMCEFTIPRKTGKPIEFQVVRMEYTSKQQNQDFMDWFTERMVPEPVLDDEGEPVVDDDGKPVTTPRPQITDREVVLKQLECSGVPKAKITQLDTLSNGEIAEISRQWEAASKVTVGESDASETS